MGPLQRRMPGGGKKGGKSKKRGKKTGGDDKRELVFKEEGQEYAQVLKMLGRVWIGQGDIILLGLREFQDEKADVIMKYAADEARNLKVYGELPDTAKINETDTFGEEGDVDENFEFDEI